MSTKKLIDLEEGERFVLGQNQYTVKKNNNDSLEFYVCPVAASRTTIKFQRSGSQYKPAGIPETFPETVEVLPWHLKP